MTDILLNDRLVAANMKRTLSAGAIVLFRTKLPKSRFTKFTTLAPIMEVEEPEPRGHRDQDIALFQTESGAELAMPNKILHLELWPKVQELPTCSKHDQQTTPTVEFTSLSLTEESNCVPIPSRHSRLPPLRTVSNFDSWQREHSRHDRDNTFTARSSGNTSVVQDPSGDLAVAVPGCEGRVERRARKRNREPAADDERVGAKRQRRTANRGPAPIIPITEKASSVKAIIHSSARLPVSRSAVFPGETTVRATGQGKRSLEDVNQGAGEGADMPRSTKRRRIGGPP
ncbi:hypothetical protein C8R45DRAFT_396362 [Mycena sanguinolenta]|nr:hypothetical protein C8R45DRAFT_396362 [Mycena sanguinolenta]